jgi:phosphotransferase system enzyme I (PtsI)
MRILQGLGGAPGCVVGKTVTLEKKSIIVNMEAVNDPDSEVSKLNKAKGRYYQKLITLGEQAKKEAGEGSAAIFEAYRQILNDDEFFGKIVSRIYDKKINVEYAIDSERAAVVKLFERIDDEYLRERASDITNVCRELIAEIQGKTSEFNFGNIKEDGIIIIADELTPADTIKIDKSALKGFVIEKGGVTSHTAILAKTIGIPAVVGLKDATKIISSENTAIVDGDEGTVIVAPDTKHINEFNQKKRAQETNREIFEKYKSKSAVTIDGKIIRVNINLGDLDSMSSFDINACDGIGLFRTEFLYMSHKSYPTENEQFEVYKTIAEKANGKEVIIRTLDIGGDKQVDYMNLEKENNPFLGYRAIRICLDRTDMFKTQLRAILRASFFGNIKIMFPMIVNMEELLQAKALVKEAKNELKEFGINYKEDIPVGIMIETPAAVLISDKLAEEVSFFSIGSNDLIQYVTATDRMNEHVQNLYNSCNISVLRSIKMVCDNAKKYNVQIGICGEIASESKLIPLFIAMGIDELSVVPSQVGKVKYIISRTPTGEMQRSLNQIINYRKIDEVEVELKKLKNY